MSLPALDGAVTLPDGTRVRGRSLRQWPATGPTPSRGLYLGTITTQRKYGPAMPWQQDWVRWRDFGLPRDRSDAVAAIVRLHAAMRAGDQVECACWGGRGRTGTVLACLVVMAGCSACEAVDFVRTHYAAKAVETRAQRRWVERFAGEIGRH